MDGGDLVAQRERMVRDHVAGRGVRDAAVLEAMREVPREAFIAPGLRYRAYDDAPLPIEDGQTISQPYIVALMLEAAAIRPTDRVLEIGAGSGYASAVAGRIAARVVAIERHPGLAASAEERLARLGYDRVEIHCADGSGGWPQDAPFDAILVAASGPRVPAALRGQLAVGGRLVMPVGRSPWDQRLLRVTRRGDDAFDEEDLGGVVFVPLIGSHAWPADRER
jgi:protein-L-isoaspartate(D-aspartate) O-methyltransferase